MRWIFPLVLLLVLLPSAWAGHSRPPNVMLRIHIQTAGEGLPSTQAQSVIIPPNNETILIRALPEVTENNLINAQPDPSGGIHLYFDHVGQVNLDAATGTNQGRIMVVLINGYVVFAPVIDEQISNGQLILPHAMSAQTLQALQAVAAQNVKKAAKM